MEITQLKIDLIRKLIGARLTSSERKEVVKKAKEIIERKKLTDCKPQNNKL